MARHLDGYSRFDLIKLLGDRSDCIGIELGVAAGEYSAEMVRSGKFREFWGVDMYADTHNTAQYIEALKNVGLEHNYRLIRMTFDEALQLFPDQYFDFLYLDGYAGNGLEGGQTLRRWASKVKIGGIIAGDDYHEDFPLLQEIVDEFVEQNEFQMMTTEGAFDFSAYGHYPSWAVYKTTEVVGETSLRLQRKGLQVSERTSRKKKQAKYVDTLLRKVIPPRTYDRLREWNRDRKKARRIRRSKNSGH
ncbi:MAG: class I SAM-dependent methyltransferase [Rhodobacteraceae bacterium]|nr:class I SAM-dependent methyltransferase [Paracoccaceae bacterium]